MAAYSLLADYEGQLVTSPPPQGLAFSSSPGALPRPRLPPCESPRGLGPAELRRRRHCDGPPRVGLLPSLSGLGGGVMATGA